MMEKTIVVIEDDAAIRESVTLILEKRNYKVRCFARVSAFDEQPFEPVDIFIIDKQLPGIDGLQLCHRLKNDEVTMKIPVIILSASHNAAALSRDAKADGFLEKPFSRSQLIDLVSALLSVNS